MWPDRVSNPGPLNYESGALPTAVRGPALGYTSRTLANCVLVDSSTVVCWSIPIAILGISGLFCRFYSIFDGKSY